MKAKIYITLKDGVLDPQGRATMQSLQNLGFSGIKDIKIGKMIEADIDEQDSAKAEEKIKEMCEKLLANTVIEKYEFQTS